MDNLNKDADAEDRLTLLKEEVTDTKKNIKEKSDLYLKEEKVMKSQHSAMVELEEKYRKLNTLIKEHSKSSNHMGLEPDQP